MIIICQVQALHHRWEKRLCLLIILRRLETSSYRSAFSRLEGTLTFPNRCMCLLRRVKVIVHASWLWRNVTRSCWGHLMKSGCLSLNCITCRRGCLSRQITSRFQICLYHLLVDSWSYLVGNAEEMSLSIEICVCHCVVPSFVRMMWLWRVDCLQIHKISAEGPFGEAVSWSMNGTSKHGPNFCWSRWHICLKLLPIWMSWCWMSSLLGMVVVLMHLHIFSLIVMSA
jgi:hypothetical protein